MYKCYVVCVVTEERCSEVESLVFDLFDNLGATGAYYLCNNSLISYFRRGLSLNLDYTSLMHILIVLICWSPFPQRSN